MVECTITTQTWMEDYTSIAWDTSKTFASCAHLVLSLPYGSYMSQDIIKLMVTKVMVTTIPVQPPESEVKPKLIEFVRYIIIVRFLNKYIVTKKTPT